MTDYREQIKNWKAIGCMTFVKWHTADDEEVCPTCKKRNDKEFPIEDIEVFFPAHRDCHCSLTPIVDPDLIISPLDNFIEWREAKKRSTGELAQEQPEDPSQQYVEFKIGFPENDYWIDLDQIPKRKALLEVLDQLSNEKWITNEMMSQLLERVCEYRGWNLYNPY